MRFLSNAVIAPNNSTADVTFALFLATASIIETVSPPLFDAFLQSWFFLFCKREASDFKSSSEMSLICFVFLMALKAWSTSPKICVTVRSVKVELSPGVVAAAAMSPDSPVAFGEGADLVFALGFFGVVICMIRSMGATSSSDVLVSSSFASFLSLSSAPLSLSLLMPEEDPSRPRSFKNCLKRSCKSGCRSFDCCCCCGRSLWDNP